MCPITQWATASIDRNWWTGSIRWKGKENVRDTRKSEWTGNDEDYEYIDPNTV